MTCETCKEQITIHADATATCSCESVDYKPGRKEWPEGWRGNEEFIETLQARELLQGALETESNELKDFVFEGIDERDVMQQAGGDPLKALEICQSAFIAAGER